jgi:hypothetical protein
VLLSGRRGRNSAISLVEAGAASQCIKNLNNAQGKEMHGTVTGRRRNILHSRRVREPSGIRSRIKNAQIWEKPIVLKSADQLCLFFLNFKLSSYCIENFYRKKLYAYVRLFK